MEKNANRLEWFIYCLY